jgi:hypothetical protein
VLADDPPSAPTPFGAESSPFARLEAEQAVSAAEAVTREAGSTPGDPVATFGSEPQRLVGADASPAEPPEEEEAGEVDRVMLAKEFSGLLQVGEDGDEE